MDNLMQIPLTGCLTKATIAAGTTTTLSNTGTITYVIKNRIYTKSAMTNAATPTTDALTGAAFPALTANKGTVVVVGLDASGNLKACQGSIVDLDADGNFKTLPIFPGLPNDFCPIGFIVLKAGSTLVGSWTFGSSNLSGVTGMTYDFNDAFGIPERPVST
jgi:hypothetical protein